MLFVLAPPTLHRSALHGTGAMCLQEQRACSRVHHLSVRSS